MVDKRTEDKPVQVEVPILCGSASRSRDGKELVLKVVHLWGGEVDVDIAIPGEEVVSLRTISLGSRHLQGVNPQEETHRIAPVTRGEDEASSHMRSAIGPCSFTIFRYALE